MKPAAASRSRLCRMLLIGVLFVGFLPSAQAAQHAWNVGSGNWNFASNWSPSGVPGSNDVVLIVDTDGIARTITYDYTGAAVTLSSLAIDLSGGAGTGTNTLAMAANALSANTETIGNVGSGTFQQSGGTNSMTTMNIALPSGTTGLFNLSGGTTSVSGNVVLGVPTTGTAGGTATLTVSSGTLTVQGTLEEYDSPNNSINLSGGTINTPAMNLNTSPVNISAAPAKFNWTAGTLNITNNVVWDPSAASTSTSAIFGSALTLNNRQTLASTGNETLGGTGSFALTMNTGGTNSVAGTLTVTSGSQLNLLGGTLSAGSLVVNGTSPFTWTAGTLDITGAGPFAIGSGGVLGSDYTLTSSQNLNVTNAVSISSDALLTINGGNFSAGSLASSGNVVFNSGTATFGVGFLNAGGSVMVIGENFLATTNGASTNSGEIQLGGEAAMLSGSGSLINNGLIHGDGIITNAVTNNFGGEIRAEDGNRLEFTGTNGTNLGKITLQGGTAQFSQPLTNGATTGQILGRGTLIVGGTGLTNKGSIAFSSGITDVFGDVHNSTGSTTLGISISGNASVTFWDDVTNGVTAGDGTLFKVSSGSTATFFGTYSGNGITGTGQVYMEADVSPGFSPASVSFGGDLNLDASSRLQMQLGGTTPGTQYDQVHVSGQLALGGILEIDLINSFTPTLGNSFDLLDWSTLSGHFSSVSLPTLAAGLAWNTTQLYTNGVLSVISTELEPGDFNRDGHVNAADILAMESALANLPSYQSTKGLTTPQLLTIGDLNGDGKVNNADLQMLLNNLLAGEGSTTSVPEPNAAVLCCLAFSGLFLWRRGR